MATSSVTLKQGSLYAVFVLITICCMRREIAPIIQKDCTCESDAKALEVIGASSSLKGGSKSDDEEHDVLEPYSGPERTYKSWPPDVPFPCFRAEPDWKTIKIQRKPSKEGLLYTREMKTGSSTMAGVYLRLAHRVGEKMNKDGSPCKMRVDHSSAREMKYAERNKKRSFLISLLRDPTKRAISSYFHFKVSENKENPIDVNFQKYFLDHPNARSNYYTKDLVMRQVNLTVEEPHEVVQEIIDSFDFIGITERMDESLVVMKMLLHLELADILYMSAKTTGSFTTAHGDNPCIYLVPSFLTAGMKAFFESDTWKEYMKYDILLYRAANKALDNTIDSLGREEFENQLNEYRALLAVAHETCAAETIYRCDPAGNYGGSKRSTCLLWDIGCGFQCLNRLDPGGGTLPEMEAGDNSTDMILADQGDDGKQAEPENGR
jgi:hypothetical protein